jgi:hypothetical protein
LPENLSSQAELIELGQYQDLGALVCSPSYIIIYVPDNQLPYLPLTALYDGEKL